MSTGKMTWGDAAAIAKQLTSELGPLVKRVKTVGSVRRRKSHVGDIELLIEPRVITSGLFSEETPDIEVVRALAHRWGKIEKAGPRMMKVILPIGIGVDLFLCSPPAQWGSLLAIRTGPARLSEHAVTCMIPRGYRHRQGRVVTLRGELVPTPREEDFFALAGLRCLSPRLRDTPAAFIALQEEHHG